MREVNVAVEDSVGYLVLDQICHGMGCGYFFDEDIEEFYLIIADYIRRNKYEFWQRSGWDCAVGLNVGEEVNKYIQRIESGDIFGQEIFWVVSSILECEIEVFMTNKTKLLYGNGYKNSSFGKLKFLISDNGQIRCVQEDGDGSTIRCLERVTNMGEVVNEGCESVVRKETEVIGKLEGKKEQIDKTLLSSRIQNNEINDEKLLTLLKEKVLESLAFEQSGNENSGRIEMVTSFFEELDMMEQGVGEMSTNNLNKLFNIERKISELAEHIGKEIVLIDEDKEYVFGVTEMKRKAKPLVIEVEGKQTRISMRSITPNKENLFRYWNRNYLRLAKDNYVTKPQELIYDIRVPGSEELLKVKRIDGDGNCLLRALLDQMGRIDKAYYMSDFNVAKLRYLISHHIKINRSRFEVFLFDYIALEGSFEDVIKKFNENGYWLGHEAMVVTAEIFNVKIRVVDKLGRIYEFGDSVNEARKLEIYYTGQTEGVLNHYDSIVKVSNNVMVESYASLSSTEIQCTQQVEKNNKSSNVSIDEVKKQEFQIKAKGRNTKDPVTYKSKQMIYPRDQNKGKNPNDNRRIEDRSIDKEMIISEEQDNAERLNSSDNIMASRKTASQQDLLKDLTATNDVIENKEVAEKAAMNSIKKNILTKIVTWNVRGCRTEEKRKEIDGTLEAYDIDIAVLQEVNTLGVEASTTNYNWIIKNNNTNKTRGLALLIRKGIGIQVQHIKISKNNMMWCKLSVRGNRLILINVHAPNVKQNTFLSNLQSLVSNQRYFKNLIVLGDFNAQLGLKDLSKEDEKYIGKELGHDVSNANGDMLKLFLHTSKLRNMSSKIGRNVKITWKCKDKQSQIDHVLAPQFNSYKIRFIKGFWTQVKTDHKMLQIGIIFSERNEKFAKVKEPTKICVELLKNPGTRKKFQEKLRNKSNPINEGQSIDQRYSNLALKLKSAASSTLRVSKIPSTPKRRRAFDKLRIAMKVVKKHPDMQNFRYKLGNRKQELAIAIKNHKEKEIMSFFRNLNDFDVGMRIRKTYSYLKQYVKEKNKKSAMISTRVWDKLLEEGQGPEIEFCDQHDFIPLPNPPTLDEIKFIINTSCNGKTPGSDRIFIEYLKHADEDSVVELVEIMRRIYIENVMPNDWKKTTQIPIPKKASASDANDFRRISLCNVAYKIYAKWIANQLNKFAGEPGLHQAAFTRSRSTDDHIFIARRLMEEYWNAGEDLVVLALDIKKAFDTVNIQNIREVLMNLNVPTRLIDRVLLCVKDEVTKVLWQNQYSREYKRGKGIKQGCPLSPQLFNFLIQDVLRKVAQQIPELKLIDIDILKIPIILAFADDILIIASNLKELEDILKVLEIELDKVGLQINHDKSQILIRYPNNKELQPKEIMLNGKMYKTCEYIKYLGVSMTATLNRKLTNRLRSVNVLRTSRLIVEFCKRFHPSWELGKLIYITVLSPALLYGTKVAVLTKKSRISMANYEKVILRNIFNNCKKDSALKFNARKLLNGKTINRRVRVGRINYFGHIKRRGEGHPLKLAYNLNLNKRKEGRPGLTWRKSLEHDLIRYDSIDNDEWEEVAMDKEKLKRKAEEIYNNEESEISEGVSTDDENQGGKRYKHWKKMS